MLKKLSKVNILDFFVIDWFLFVGYCWVISYFKIFTLDAIKLFIYPSLLVFILLLLTKLKSLKFHKFSFNSYKTQLLSDPEQFLPSLLTTILITVIILFQLFAILRLPPTNWDSMTYHLPKVTLALQNNSMILPSNIPITRIISSPWNSEISNLAFYSIFNNDIVVELPQLLSAIGILLLLRRYFNKKQDWLMLALLSVPLFVSQMITTQNDLLLYFLAFYSFITLEEAFKNPSINKFVLFIIGGSLLVGTKVNGLPILGVITLVLTIHYIYNAIKNKSKIINIEKGKLIRNISVIGVLVILAIIVAFPSYYYSKKVYDNYLYQPPETASRFKIGLPTIQENIIHFGYYIIKPQQFTFDIFNHDTGHLGNVFIISIIFSLVAMIMSRRFRIEIMTNSLFQVSLIYLLVFISIHSPDVWDLRLVLFPLLTLLILALKYLSQNNTFTKNILMGVVLVGAFTNIFTWIWFVTPNIKNTFKNENYTIADYTRDNSLVLEKFENNNNAIINTRNSIVSLNKDKVFNTDITKSFLIIASEDTWTYPYFDMNKINHNQIDFSKFYIENNYDFVVIDKYLYGKNNIKNETEVCNTIIGEDIYTIIYKRDLNKCNRDLIK